MPLRLLLCRIFARPWLLPGLLASLAACQPQPNTAATARAEPPPTGHFAGTLQAPGQPAFRAVLEVRHPSPGHYEAELVLPEQPALSFVADSLTFTHDTLRLVRPGRTSQQLALVRQGNFWRGMLGLDSARYPLLLVRRGEPEPAVYHVQRDEVAGTTAPALLFSPADESLPGLALAFFPSVTDAQAGPAWADALARQGHTVLVLPPADNLSAPALANALALLRRTAGVDTARVGAWVNGPSASLLPLLLAENTASRPTFILVQNMPAPPLAVRRDWHALAQRGQVLAVYDAAQPKAAVAQARVVLGAQHVRQAPAAKLPGLLTDWLRGR